MTDKQQTAVQWLVDKLIKGEFINSTDELVEQALEMEREQIIDAHYEGQCHNLEGYQKYIEKLYTSHQYFTNTYQSEP